MPNTAEQARASAVELDLARKRLSRREEEYRKLVVSIERNWRKRELAEKALTRLTRKLATLEKDRVRLARNLDRMRLVVKAEEQQLIKQEAAPAESAPNSDGLDIPAELRRVAPPAISADDPDLVDKVAAALDRNRKLQALPDPKTKEKKAERRAIEKEKREAELTGKRRKMPLSGKAARAAIRKADYDVNKPTDIPWSELTGDNLRR